MSRIILEIEKVECGYGSNRILRGVDFAVKEGEVIGIIGPNGSGKTTLLRAITRVLPLTAGAVRFKGKPLSAIEPKNLAKEIAVVSQGADAAFSGITVEETVLLGRIPHFTRYQWVEKKADFEIIEEAMRLTGVAGFRERDLANLSGGERQRVFIARALAQKPQLLLLDEPTTHLDITHQVGILDLMRKLNKTLGLTVIMVLHDLNLASEYCNRIALLNEGRIQSSGPPEDVINFQTIEEVYKTLVVVDKSPVSGKPHVFVASEEKRQKEKS